MMAQTSYTANAARETEPTQMRSEVRLQDLIPIVMVIVGGCEPCAEKAVDRALQDGSSLQDVDRTLRMVAHLHGRDCFAKAVGSEVLVRMQKPLAAGRRALEEAMRRNSGHSTDSGCS